MKKLLLALSMGLACSTAQALSIGEIEVKSALGQALSARVPLTLQAGEDVVIGCVRLEEMGSKNTGVPMLIGYSLELEAPKQGKAAILIKTSAALVEPAVRVGLVIRCGKTSSSREFVINQKLQEARK